MASRIAVLRAQLDEAAKALRDIRDMPTSSSPLELYAASGRASVALFEIAAIPEKLRTQAVLDDQCSGTQ